MEAAVMARMGRENFLIEFLSYLSDELVFI
jgi:hypothetical protein